MTETDDDPGGRRARTAQRKATREDRSAAALRDNLKRRKEQARARVAGAPDGGDTDVFPATPTPGRRDPA